MKCSLYCGVVNELKDCPGEAVAFGEILLAKVFIENRSPLRSFCSAFVPLDVGVMPNDSLEGLCASVFRGGFLGDGIWRGSLVLFQLL